MFTQGLPSDSEEYKKFIKVMINNFQLDYSAGLYLRQYIWYGKVLDLEIPNNPNKHDNQLDFDFDMGVFGWK